MTTPNEQQVYAETLKCCIRYLRDENLLIRRQLSYALKPNAPLVRPTLVFLACELTRCSWRKAINAAAAIELLHNSTLVHDDIIDHSERRRGRLSMYTKYGMEAAVIAGNVLLTKAYEAIQDKGIPDLPQNTRIEMVIALSKANCAVQRGQMLDLIYEKRKSISVNEYFEMAKFKTVSLFEASMKLGLIIGGAGPDLHKQVSSMINNLGYAYQIRNDLSNLVKLSGKDSSFGDDIKRGKKTLPYIHLLRQRSRSQRAPQMWRQGADQVSVISTVELLESSGSIEFAKQEMMRQIQITKRKISQLPSLPAREKLLDFVGRLSNV